MDRSGEMGPPKLLAWEPLMDSGVWLCRVARTLWYAESLFYLTRNVVEGRQGNISFIIVPPLLEYMN